MKGNHDPAGAIVMDYHIVDALYMFVTHYNSFHVFHKVRLRGLAQQRANGIFGGGISGVENKQAHQDAALAIDFKPCKMGGEGSCQHNGGSEGIA